MVESDNANRPQPCLRALSGPLAGSVFVVGEGLRIGRGDDCEVQSVTRTTSRSHAQVLRNGDDIVLVDMLSTNGTWVGGHRVERERLQVGEEFHVGGARFLVDAFVPDQEGGAPPTDRIVDARVKASTHRIVVGVAEEDPPARPAPAPAPSRQDMGGIVAGIVLYRNLRPLISRGGEVRPSLQEHFRHLRTTLTSSDATGATVAREFECALPAKVAFESDHLHGFGTQVRRISVDGATIAIRDSGVEVGALCWLSLPVVRTDGLRTAVVTSRVKFVRSDELQLTFFGAPGWARATPRMSLTDFNAPTMELPQGRGAAGDDES